MDRERATGPRIERFLQELGKRYRGGGRFYLVGGAQMVQAGFRTQTEDIDYTVQLDGDDETFTRAVRSLIRELRISVEPAGPGDFIPLPKGWEERSRFIGRYGSLDVYAFDAVSTALSKIERGSRRDIDDVLELLREGIVTGDELEAAFEEILPRLDRESLRVDEDDFRRKYEALLQLVRQEESQAAE